MKVVFRILVNREQHAYTTEHSKLALTCALCI